MAVIGRHLIYGNGQEAEAKVILLFQSSPVPKGPTTWEGHAQVLLPATNGEMQGEHQKCFWETKRKTPLIISGSPCFLPFTTPFLLLLES